MAGNANINLPGAPNYPVPGNPGLGAIQGGLIRPGSIDQGRFQQLLQAQQQTPQASSAPPGMTLDDYRKLAGAPISSPAASTPSNAATARPSDGIPTLSSEQFAALTGTAPPNQLPAAISAAENAPATGMPATIGAPFEMVPPKIANQPEMATQIAAIDPAMDPVVESDGHENGLADGIPVTSPDSSAASVKGTPDENDPRVVWFDTMPDREERRMIEASGKRWRIREVPGARELFLGPDGNFGWDDALDMINPLQHIPIVAQIYRAVTGDQAYALSQFAGAIPFGPISIAAAVIDTVVRSETGRDAGTDIAAAVLGIDNRTPEEANIHLAMPATRDMAQAPAPVTPNQTAAAFTDPDWMRETRGGAG